MGQGARAARLGASARGLTGAVLLLVLPASSFAAIVPAFVAIALLLTVLQPRLNARFHKQEIGIGAARRVLTSFAVYASAVYGGYFGADQGILLIAIREPVSERCRSTSTRRPKTSTT